MFSFSQNILFGFVWHVPLQDRKFQHEDHSNKKNGLEKSVDYFDKITFIFCLILISVFYKINTILLSIFIPKMHFLNVKRSTQFLTYGFSDRITTFLKDFTLNNYREIIILRKNYLLNKNLLPNTLNMTAGQVSHYGIKRYY